MIAVSRRPPHRDDRNSLVILHLSEMTRCTVFSSLDAGFPDMAGKVGLFSL